MAKAAAIGSTGKQFGEKRKRAAYSIAMCQKCEAFRIEIVVAAIADAALARIRRSTIDRTAVEIVGALSQDMAQQRGLKSSEMRLL